MCARYDKDWIASLLDVENRLGDTTPEQCLRDAGVTAGQTVVDYGCGPGLFTFPAAEIVGAGGQGVRRRHRAQDDGARREQGVRAGQPET